MAITEPVYAWYDGLPGDDWNEWYQLADAIDDRVIYVG